MIEIVRDEVVYDGKYVQFIERHIKTRDGRAKIWEMFKRKIYGRVVATVGLTPRNEVVLVKVWRVPHDCWVIEASAGLTDIKGETDEQAAARELLEETGYKGDELVKLATGPADPGLNAGEMTYYAALNVKEVGKPQLETTEVIEVIIIPHDKAVEFLLNPPPGHKVDIKLFGALKLLERYVL